jgi:transmembrane sensor
MTSPRREPRIADKLVDAVSEEDLAAVWRRVERGSARRSRRRASLRAGVAALVIALVAGGGYALLSSASGEGPGGASQATAALTRADGSAFVRVGASERVVLRDRSRIETRDGAIEVLENASGSLALHLQGGRARFEVTPHTGRRWRVEAGGVSVDVVGTIFTVQRSAEAIDVAVERGVVVVRGARVPDGVRRLTAGRSLRVELEPVASAPLPEIEPETEALSASPGERAEPAPSAPAIEPAPPTARALLDAADEARRAGRREEAISALTTLVRTHPRSREAPLAAFTAARLHRESGRTDEAAVWYRRALALGLPAPLDDQAREALDALEDPPE